MDGLDIAIYTETQCFKCRNMGLLITSCTAVLRCILQEKTMFRHSHIPLTVNNLFFQLNGDGVRHSAKIVCAWLLTNPVYFRHCHDGSLNWTTPHCTLEHWDGKSDQHVFEIY